MACFWHFWLSMQNHRLLHFFPPASVSSQPAASASASSMPGEVTDRRIGTGGSSRGLSPAARPLLLVDADRCAFRSSGPACTALSSIKQVVRLSHNFIVHFSPTEGHGAMQKITENQQVSSGNDGQRHVGEDQLRLFSLRMLQINITLLACWKPLVPAGSRYAAWRNIQGARNQ